MWRYGIPDDSGYPWEEPTLHVANYPTPGMFADLNDRSGLFFPWQGFDAFVRAALASALIRAEVDPATAESRTSHARRLRQQMRVVILSSQWNDELSGCTNENYCGGAHPLKRGGGGKTDVADHVMHNGRGIAWLPRHANNRERISEGRAPQRTIGLDGEVLPGTVARWYPLVWVPAVVFDGEGFRFLRWSDGTSTREPPPAIARLGIDNPVSLPGMPGYESLTG